MKVINGKFGGEDDKMSPFERLQDQLKRAELRDATGQYLLIWDMGDALVLLSNMDEAGDVYITCAKAQTAVMATTFETVPPEAS